MAGTIWIDLSTAPDPLFFRPIVRRLEERGYHAWITAREYGETTAIAEQCGLDFTVVGRHGGATVTRKGAAIVERATELAKLARRRRPIAACSYNSYAQGLAAKLLRVPFVTIMDYEYQPANHLAFRLARTVIVPEGFDRTALRRQGAKGKAVMHRGLKEHVTLVDFAPDPRFPAVLEELGVARDDVLVTLRPPATQSVYHRFENDLFDEAVVHLAGQPGVKALVLPRYPSQAEALRRHGLEGIVIPSRVLDGLNLVYWSDLVISGGGSMNREAVVVGTPACTLFQGKMAGVDRKMIAEGVLGHLRSMEDLANLAPRKRLREGTPKIDDGALNDVLDGVFSAA